MTALQSPAEQLITDNIDVWTSVIKKRGSQGRGSSKKTELYGIKKLRDLILELAVRGLLVPQDPSDEPASVLLEKIAAEKEQLIKIGKLKKQKPLTGIRVEEKPFTLPRGWVWVRFGNIYELEYGNNLPQAKRSNTGEYPVYGSNGIVGTHNDYCIEKPCIVVGRKGSAGALNLNEGDGCWVTDVAYSIVPPTDLLLSFVLIQLNTLGLDSLGKGIKPGLNRNEAYQLQLALPPEAEQPRIVAKVDELMALCDQLEQQTETSLTAHQTLVENLLNTLLNAAQSKTISDSDHTSTASSLTKDSFDQAWNRIAQHFDVLFTTEHSIDQLKQTILQLAVMGKLVPQDPNDEPASKLLEKIAAEKEQLIKDKKIKKQKPLPPIDDDEKPFELPKGWEWVTLSEINAIVTDGDHQAPPKASEGIPFLVIGNLNKGKIDFTNSKYVPVSYYEKLDWTRKPSSDDLLYTVTGSYGITVKIDSDKPFCVQRHVAILKGTKSTPKEYLIFALSSKIALDYSAEVATGIAQKTVPLNGLRRMPIALPPKEEYLRIVNKVRGLMALCDNLKLCISESQFTQLLLADAVAEETLV
jgi:type I restriction enzyme S subunit